MGGHLQQPLRCCPWKAWYEGHWPLPHKSVLLALSQSLKVVSTPEPREPLALQKPAFAPDFSTGSPMDRESCKSGDTIPQVYADQFVCICCLDLCQHWSREALGITLSSFSLLLI